MLKPENFTEQAQEMLTESQDLVRKYKHSNWDVEHILLALVNMQEGNNRDTGGNNRAG